VYPFVINGDLWRVIRVPAGDPSLIDRTGSSKLAVTDSMDRTVYIRNDLMPPLVDRVMLHEVTHAITVSWGLLPEVRSGVIRGDIIDVEEWAAQLVENHAMEAVQATMRALGRPVCVRGLCSD